jgi:hypothetical protein
MDVDQKQNPLMNRGFQTMVGFTSGGAIIMLAALGGWYFLSLGPSMNGNGLIIWGCVSLVVAVMIYVGFRIIIAGVSVEKEVIPHKDRSLLEPLISAGDEKAIDQYVRLSSLTGATGLATKLGLTGLPLLTVALTLIFSGLELYRPGTGFMDLAKLTLGAFIGSFVQRVASTQQAAANGAIRLPPVA